MSDRPIVTRFAPSPTGDLHVGGARTALFCWALARAQNGRFVIRLEDTDRARSSEASAQAILDDLAWLGLDWDDGPEFAREGRTIGGDERGIGPFKQSERLDLYDRAIETLIEQGRAYPAFDTPEALTKRRDEATKAKKTFIYRRAEGFDTEAALARMRSGEECVIRFAADTSASHDIEDTVLGSVPSRPGELEDFVIRKRDGFPTYHLAVVVDDALMGVTHVLRGQEHLSNTPKHVALQRALGYEIPVYAHMPLIFNDRGQKMSKRERDGLAREFVTAHGGNDLIYQLPDESSHPRFDAWLADSKSQLEPADLEALATFAGIELPEVSVRDFRDAGYTPEALTNFIALLGWTPPKNDDGTERERFDLAFIGRAFGVETIGRSNARFDRKKLLNFNMESLAALEPEVFVDRFRAWPGMPRYGLVDLRHFEHFDVLARAVQPQSKTFADAAERCSFAIVSPTAYDAKAVKKFLAKNEGEGLKLLASLRERLAALEAWDEQSLHACVEQLGESTGAGMGKIAQPVRIALTGAGVSPPIGVTLWVLGRDETCARIDRCLEAHAERA